MFMNCFVPFSLTKNFLTMILNDVPFVVLQGWNKKWVCYVFINFYFTFSSSIFKVHEVQRYRKRNLSVCALTATVRYCYCWLWGLRDRNKQMGIIIDWNCYDWISIYKRTIILSSLSWQILKMIHLVLSEKEYLGLYNFQRKCAFI